ncbi:hypothetical protein GOP47_0008460 [Adiantum capillus-veneris]|uniref:RING-type domain-containing protein n=1 Tax=Adiantum capillus-veneris TaxID=13818 RepID=A0A9D4UYC6_ADICA|nr:hypothetical protein GOP47_0008460 [Adiantum capillus-veneris]
MAELPSLLAASSKWDLLADSPCLTSTRSHLIKNLKIQKRQYSYPNHLRKQFSQMSLTQLTNNGGKGFSTGPHVPIRAQVEVVKASNGVPYEESAGGSLAVPFRINTTLNPENVSNSLSQFYESVGAGLSNPVNLSQQGFVQANVNAPGSDTASSSGNVHLNTSLSLDACCSPENKHATSHSLVGTVSSVGAPVNGNYTGMNVVHSSFMPRQGIKPQPDISASVELDRSKMVGKASASDSINNSFSHSEITSASCCECNEAISLNAPGTELSLAIASVVDNGSPNTEDSHSFISSFNNAPQSIGSSNIDKAVTRKDEMFLRLVQQVRELEVQLQERRSWAHQKALQAACKFTKDMSELKSLRLEHEEILNLKKDTQALEDNTMKRLTEMESALRKAGAQVDKANASVRKLETENAELKAEMEAAKLSAAESNAKCQEVAKREKKSSKKIQAWEKQKAKMLEEIMKQKQQIIQVQEQLATVKIQQHDSEMRWRQEEKAKEDALAIADAEKWAREQLELVAKRKEETWRQKADADFQRHKDDIQRLESELEQLKVAAAEVSNIEYNSGGISLQNADANGLQNLKETSSQLMQELAELQDSRDMCRDRECVMCMSEESSVVFLPCAHQIVCVNCNDLHQKRGMRDCPSCRTMIQRRIQVSTALSM